MLGKLSRRLVEIELEEERDKWKALDDDGC